MPPKAEHCVLVGIRDAQTRNWKRKPLRVPGLGVGPSLLHGLPGTTEGRIHWEISSPWPWLHLLWLIPSQVQQWWSEFKLGHLHFLGDHISILFQTLSRDFFNTQLLMPIVTSSFFIPRKKQGCDCSGRTGHPTIPPADGRRGPLFPGLGSSHSWRLVKSPTREM